MTVRPSLFPDTRSYPALVLFALVSGFVVAMLDITAANAAISGVRAEFRASPTALLWVVDAYVLTFATLLLFGGALAKRIGSRRAYLIGLMCFVIASAASAMAPNVEFLIGARLLQGAGAALFMPSSLSLFNAAFQDKALRTRMLGMWAAIVCAGAGTSPFVGGLLVAAGGWRSIFYLNVPLGVAGIVLTWMCVAPSVRHPQRIEAAGSHPVIPGSLAGSRAFWCNNLIGFVANFVIFGDLFFLSLYLQNTGHANPLRNGAQLLPLMAIVSIMSMASGYLSARHGRITVLLSGITLAIVSCLAGTWLGSTAPFWQIELLVVSCNAGVGLAIAATISGVMHEATPAEAGAASATLNASRLLGAFAGVATIGVTLHGDGAWPARLHNGFLLLTVCLAAALIAAWSLRRQIRR